MFIDKTEKETILKPLQVVIGIVERKQTLPILSNVLIEKEAGKIRFTATDLEIQITTTIETKALIKANKSQFRLQTLPAQDFPKLNNQLTDAKKIVLHQSMLKKLLLSVQYAMAQQDVRYYLNGVLLIIEGNKLKVVATDGHRLAFNAGIIDGNHEKHEIIMPRKAVTELCKLLGDTNESVEVEFSTQ